MIEDEHLIRGQTYVFHRISSPTIIKCRAVFEDREKNNYILSSYHEFGTNETLPLCILPMEYIALIETENIERSSPNNICSFM